MTEALDFLGLPIRVGGKVVYLSVASRYRGTRICKAKVVAISSSNSTVVIADEDASHHEFTKRPDLLITRVADRPPVKGDVVVTFETTNDVCRFVKGVVDVMTPKGAIIKLDDGSETLVSASRILVIQP